MLDLTLFAAAGSPVLLRAIIRGNVLKLPKLAVAKVADHTTAVILGIVVGAALSNVWAAFLKQSVPDQAIVGLYALAFAYPVLSLLARVVKNGMKGFKRSNFYTTNFGFIVGALVGFGAGKGIIAATKKRPRSRNPEDRLSPSQKAGFQTAAIVYAVVAIGLTIMK